MRNRFASERVCLCVPIGSLFGRGYWVAPFLVSAAVMAVGALIWIFLIDPDRSVVGT